MKVSPVLPGPAVFIILTIAERVAVGFVCMIVENTVEKIVIDAKKLIVGKSKFLKKAILMNLGLWIY